MTLVLNEKIKHSKILLIDEKGTKVGIVDKKEALDKAYELNLDLVQVNDQEVPVCKIMDHSKFLYEQKKKQRTSKESKVKWKEIQLGVNIGDNDLKVKAKNAQKQVDKGNKVKVVLTLKGRQITHKDLGKNVLEKFKTYLDEVEVEKDVFSEGNKLIMHLSK